MEMIVLFEDGEMDSTEVRDWYPADETKTFQDLTDYLEAEERARVG